MLINSKPGFCILKNKPVGKKKKKDILFKNYTVPPWGEDKNIMTFYFYIQFNDVSIIWSWLLYWLLSTNKFAHICAHFMGKLFFVFWRRECGIFIPLSQVFIFFMSTGLTATMCLEFRLHLVVTRPQGLDVKWESMAWKTTLKSKL